MVDPDTACRNAAALLANDRSTKAMGISIEVPKAGQAVATMEVRDDMINGFDVIHGGLTFALADTACAFACNTYGEQTVAASAQIEFLRPARLGDTLTATAREDHRGRRNGYYTVAVRNQRDELVALFRGRTTSNGKSHQK
jgi:acyl-CoA thioesterase